MNQKVKILYFTLKNILFLKNSPRVPHYHRIASPGIASLSFEHNTSRVD